VSLHASRKMFDDAVCGMGMTIKFICDSRVRERGKLFTSCVKTGRMHAVSIAYLLALYFSFTKQIEGELYRVGVREE
jgi:hypothetical protein